MARSNARVLFRLSSTLVLFAGVPVVLGAQQPDNSSPLRAAVDKVHGAFSLENSKGGLRGASVAVEVDHHWLRASDLGQPTVTPGAESGELGAAESWTVAYPQKTDGPTLSYRLRAYRNAPFADLQITVRNTTAHNLTLEDIRPVDISSEKAIDLGAPEANERVLSDSLSEDRPQMAIHDLADAPHGVHRAAGSQLFFNRQSGQSLFIAALTSDKFLTVFKAHVPSGSSSIASDQIADTGTTEFMKEWSLEHAPAQDQLELSVTLAPGEEIKSERLLISLSDDYHYQLETYAHIIRDLHRGRVSAPTPMGWWSWTAYYAKLDEAKTLATADWMAENLKPLGYTFVHIDEGYAIGRGDYLTSDAKLFPNGMEPVEKKIAALGLTPAIWTAPFEVSELSWVYKNHSEWLVKNAEGKPIALPGATPPNRGRIYALDPTNPGARDYLTKTYSTMASEWGIRYFKLDFMEDSAIEGVHYRPNTSALEAQRIGLEIIRAAVGNEVWLDKDGSPMLNPVGIVDMGRISQDTGHHFQEIKDAATGIAARYYMNRNWFIADPDAFMVTKGEGKHTMTLDEAKVSIALSAVSGGMFEIGDIVTSLDAEPDRLALIRNPALIEMAKRGAASTPIDLLTYAPEDLQPSIFFLKPADSSGAGILTVFNWSNNKRTHELRPEDVGLTGRAGNYQFEDVWTGKKSSCDGCVPTLELAPHSVAMLKITAE
jgi:alpha-galactosidase